MENFVVVDKDTTMTGFVHIDDGDKVDDTFVVVVKPLSSRL